MLTGNDIIILTANDANKLLKACGFSVHYNAGMIRRAMEERFEDESDAYEAFVIILELRNIVREKNDMSVWDSTNA